MSRKQLKTICALLWVLIAVLMIGCAVKEHTPTEDEMAAEKVTEELIAERSEHADDTEAYPGDVHWMDDSDVDMSDGSTVPEDEVRTTQAVSRQEIAATEEENDFFDAAGRYITETPDVYESYKADEETEVYQAPDKWENGRYQFTSDEVWEMTRIVYLENGITWPECAYNTVYLTACVILNRLYDWDECGTVYEVIWQAGQYSTADRYHDYNGDDLGSSNPDGWEISAAAVWDAIENTDRHPHFQSMGAQGEVYYVDPTTGETFCY